MRILDRLGSIMVVNILFIVFSIPVVTIGASTSAMYRCFLTMAKDGDSNLTQLFWSAFRKNFKKATLLELCVLPVLALVILEVMLFLSGAVGTGVGRCVLFVFPFILVSCVISYVFPLQAQFENTVFQTIKNAGLLALSHLPVTVVITAANLVFPVMMYFFTDLFAKTLVAWLLFGFAAVAYFNTALLRKVFEQYFPEEKDKNP